MHKSYFELFNRIESSSGIIFINTFEETKVIRALHSNFSKDTINFWSATQGLHSINVDHNKTETFEPYDFAVDNAKKSKKGASSVGNILSALDIIEIGRAHV